MEGGGQVGAAMFIAGSLVTCLLSLVFALPVSLTAAIYMSEMATPAQQRFLRPIVELFTGIPSVIYGWIGLTVLVPFLRQIFPMPFGFSVLAASLVLAVMIFPVITTMAADAMLAVPKTWRDASYGLGATRWETIRQVILPAAHRGIFTGIVLGMARALGEALAVAMVIGQMKRFPHLPVYAGQHYDHGDCQRHGRGHGGRRIQCSPVGAGTALVPAVLPVNLYDP